MNQITITGRLGKDVELRTTQSGLTVAKFSIAANRPTKDKQADWFEVEAWKQSAEYVAKYASKGSMVAVVGRMENDRWEDRDGNKRDGWRLKADRVEVLDSKASATEEDGGDVPF